MISAGRVLIVPRGEWNAETTYRMLDLVNHNGYAYLAKRTVVGIEPSNDYPDYWHNMLDIDKIIENAIAETISEEVGDILEERFRDMLSEAKYVTDLNDPFDMPTFVKWDVETENTPYKSGLTQSTEGFAFVYGEYNKDHTIVAWTKIGENFTHRVVGGSATEWDKTITSSGGTMTGPLGLGGGKGSVSADDGGAFIETARENETLRQIKVKNPSVEESLEQAAKIIEKKEGVPSEFNLFGEHNMDLMSSLGFARIEYGSYIGTGTYGKDNPRSITFKRVPKVVFVCGKGPYLIAVNGCENVSLISWIGNYTISVSTEWNDKTFTWIGSSVKDVGAKGSLNTKDQVYYYLAITE